MILDGPESSKFHPDRRQDSPVSDFTRKVRSRDGSGFYCAKSAPVTSSGNAPT
jgi:hypothetical protein